MGVSLPWEQDKTTSYKRQNHDSVVKPGIILILSNIFADSTHFLIDIVNNQKTFTNFKMYNLLNQRLAFFEKIAGEHVYKRVHTSKKVRKNCKDWS